MSKFTCEDNRMLMKEIKEDLNRRSDIPCSWIRELNVVKMSVLLISIYSCSSYQYISKFKKNQNSCKIFCRYGQGYFKVYVESQRNQNCYFNPLNTDWAFHFFVLFCFVLNYFIEVYAVKCPDLKHSINKYYQIYRTMLPKPQSRPHFHYPIKFSVPLSN